MSRTPPAREADVTFLLKLPAGRAEVPFQWQRSSAVGRHHMLYDRAFLWLEPHYPVFRHGRSQSQGEPPCFTEARFVRPRFWQHWGLQLPARRWLILGSI